MASGDVPTFSGLVMDLNTAKRGYGLHIRTIQKVNSLAHVRAPFGFDGRFMDLDSATTIRDGISQVIAEAPGLADHAVALAYILNHEDTYNFRLGERQASLEHDLGIGKKSRESLEKAGIQVLAHALLMQARVQRA